MRPGIFPTSTGRDLRTSDHDHMGSLSHIQITREITAAKKINGMHCTNLSQ